MANLHHLIPTIAVLVMTMPIAGCDQKPIPTRAVEAPVEFQEVRARIAAMVEAGEIPSMAVAVARDGKIVWMEGIGWADIAAEKPAGPDTVYAIGSTSKSMAATLAMALSEKGLLDIDKGIDAYLDGDMLMYLAIDGVFPTIRQLLTMTGGVPHGGGLTGNPEYTLSRDALGQRIAITAYPPGTVYEYSNYSIGLAMRAMERATGRSYADLMQDYVFEPLGMSNSSVSYRNGAEDQALLYNSRLEAIDYYRFYPEGAAGFYSSAADLMRFALFHAGIWHPDETVISAENLAKMHGARPRNLPGALSAMGWGSIDMPNAGVTQLISNGNVSGGNSHLSVFKTVGGVVITALNMTSRESVADFVALDISDILVPDLKTDFMDLMTSYEGENDRTFVGDPAWTGRWRGVLEGEGYAEQVEMSITAEGGIDITLGNSASIALERPRNPFGTITARVEELPIRETGRGTLEGSQQLRLSLQGDSLFGHVVVRIVDGDMRGDYPYRMRLNRAEDPS